MANFAEDGQAVLCGHLRLRLAIFAFADLISLCMPSEEDLTTFTTLTWIGATKHVPTVTKVTPGCQPCMLKSPEAAARILIIRATMNAMLRADSCGRYNFVPGGEPDAARGIQPAGPRYL